MWDDGCHSVAVFYTAFRLCKTKEARCVLGVVFCWQISHKALRAVFTVHSVYGTSWWRLVITAARQLGTISSLNLPSVQSVQLTPCRPPQSHTHSSQQAGWAEAMHSGLVVGGPGHWSVARRRRPVSIGHDITQRLSCHTNKLLHSQQSPDLTSSDLNLLSTQILNSILKFSTQISRYFVHLGANNG